MTINSIVRALEIDKNKVFKNLKETGNTVSASIPICIKQCIEQGKLKKGSKILISGFGAGYSYGSILVEI
jgi:3-oxoacyl-[acyl-carrier-protein] synthase-3